jgi:hypothetical protein
MKKLASYKFFDSEDRIIISDPKRETKDYEEFVIFPEDFSKSQSEDPNEA